METVGRIRREHFVKGRSIKEIARDLRISRNTVRRILRSGETSFSYVREVQPRPRLGRRKADLDRMLTTNAGNTTRERLTLIRLFEQLHAGLPGRLRRGSPLRADLEPGSTQATQRRLSSRCRSHQAKLTSSTGGRVGVGVGFWGWGARARPVFGASGCLGMCTDGGELWDEVGTTGWPS